MSIQTRRSLLLASVTLLVPMLQPALAQNAFQPAPQGGQQESRPGLALEVNPALDPWSGFRHGLRLGATAVSPASDFVRGCNGFVTDETLGVALEIAEGVERVVVSADGEQLSALLVAGPDGLYQCALPSLDGAVNAWITAPRAGRYTVLPALPASGAFDTRLVVADRPVSGLELHGLRVDRLAAPRAGHFTLTAEAPRQRLTQSGLVQTRTAMASLTAQGRCAGFSDFSAADAVVQVSEAGQVSFNAVSERDLTIAVRTPTGEVLCNDDSFMLNPAVSHVASGPGEYHVFVGAFSQGAPAAYTLYAGMGAPDWGQGSLDLEGTPRLGSFDFGPGSGARVLGRGRVQVDTPLQLYGLGDACYGMIGNGAPDALVQLREGGGPVSFYARSEEGDLVIAVRGPDGSWLCNDDSDGLNPAVTFPAGEAGEYAVMVGVFSEYSNGAGYELMASEGRPNWRPSPGGRPATPGRALPSGGSELGSLDFGAHGPVDPRLIFDIRPSSTPLASIDAQCAGMAESGTPDLIVNVTEPQDQLLIYLASDADGVLMVVTPSGEILCNDDYYGLNPGVAITQAEAGSYAVFAGTYRGEGGLATLGVTRNSPLWSMDREH